MKAKLTLIFFIALSSSCNTHKFKAKDCIRDKSGYTWFISSTNDNGYVAMGWRQDSWGNLVQIPKETIEWKDNYLVPCPHQH